MVNGLKGIVDLLSDEPNSDEIDTYIQMANQVSHELLEEIISQRSLMAAENGDLALNISEVNPKIILDELLMYLKHQQVAVNKQLQIHSTLVDSTIKTDATLLKRILINLVKNALEASVENGVVTITTYAYDDHQYFTVHNQTTMNPKIKAQIFQRSFSTKGKNRGIGTYSIKLFTEKYLLGKVNFQTSEKDGTTFTIAIPKIIHY